MKKTSLIGLPVALLLVFGLLASCVGDPAVQEPAADTPRPITPEEAAVIEEVEDLLKKWMDENLSFVLDNDGNMHNIINLSLK